jgi:ABC-type multidrug transport system fused ATPase/permease subunit
MLARVLRAPMAFFDTTPIGRLLNRFGKDIEVADTLLPMNVRYFVQCLTMVVATLGIICFSTWMFALLIVPLFLFYYYMLVCVFPLSSFANIINSFPLPCSSVSTFPLHGS